MTTAITEYKPLLEVVDTQKRRYYTAMTREEFEQFLMSDKDHIYFSISKRGLRKAYIVNYGPADEEVVRMEWMLSELNEFQKRCFEATKQRFLDYWKGTRPLTQERVQHFIDLAKKGSALDFSGK